MVVIAKGSVLLTTYSPARAALYVTLIGDREATWSVAALAAAMRVAADVASRDSVRSGLLMLLDDGVAVEVQDSEVLTVQLSASGANTLGMILNGWRGRGEQVPS